MGKPRKGYKRKSIDLKEDTIRKAQIKVAGSDKTAKEYIEILVEKHFDKVKL